MEIVPAVVVAALLVALSVGMVVSHVRTWNRVRSAGLDADEHDYRRRQFRRRMQASVMIGIVGVCLVIGSLIPTDWPSVYVVFWVCVMLLVVWIAILALGDIWSTRTFVTHMHREHIVEKAKLDAELRRAKAKQGNGKPESRGKG